MRCQSPPRVAPSPRCEVVDRQRHRAAPAAEPVTLGGRGGRASLLWHTSPQATLRQLSQATAINARRRRATAGLNAMGTGRPGRLLGGRRWPVAGLHVSRWTRGRHDRLYVSTRAGHDVGWHDPRTRRESLQQPPMRRQFSAAIERWKREHPGTLAATVRVPASPGPTRAPRDSRSLAAEDLTTRRAGASPALRARQVQIRNPVLRGLARAAGLRTRDLASPGRQGASGPGRGIRPQLPDAPCCQGAPGSEPGRRRTVSGRRDPGQRGAADHHSWR